MKRAAFIESERYRVIVGVWVWLPFNVTLPSRWPFRIMTLALINGHEFLVSVPPRFLSFFLSPSWLCCSLVNCEGLSPLLTRVALRFVVSRLFRYSLSRISIFLGPAPIHRRYLFLSVRSVIHCHFQDKTLIQSSSFAPLSSSPLVLILT
jgi:hypothetical protein